MNRNFDAMLVDVLDFLEWVENSSASEIEKALAENDKAKEAFAASNPNIKVHWAVMIDFLAIPVSERTLEVRPAPVSDPPVGWTGDVAVIETETAGANLVVPACSLSLSVGAQLEGIEYYFRGRKLITLYFEGPIFAPSASVVHAPEIVVSLSVT